MKKSVSKKKKQVLALIQTKVLLDTLAYVQKRNYARYRRDIPEMNKAIHEFIGGKWTLIANTRGGSIAHIRYYTTSFDKCEKAAKFHNKHAEHIYRVVPHIRGCCYEFSYHSSFDALMPVVRKITNLKEYNRWLNLQVKERNYEALVKHLKNADIHNSHKAVFAFIEWYNQYTANQK